MKKYIGSKDFYLNILRIGLPLALANLLQSCMSIVDGIMVSSIGMVTAVGNARNIITLNDMTEYGIISGISIFGSQFFGAKNKENMSKTFGLCLIATLLNVFFWITVTFTIGEKVLYFFLPDQAVCDYSFAYIRIVILAMIPGAIAYSIATMFRCIHETRLTFIISAFGSIVNIVFNYLFIFIFKMGIEGAAYGTLVASSCNCLVYIIALLRIRPDFFLGFKECFDFNFDFIKPVFATTIPLVLNESLFGIGQTLFTKAYGLLGTQSMDAYYVSNEIFNLFTFIIWGFGNAVAISIGTTLGQGKTEQAKEESNYHLGLGFLIGTTLSILVAVLAPLFIKFYHVTNPVTYAWTKGLLYVLAVKIFLRTFNYMMFSTLKAGGDSKIINILDSGIMYLVGIPLAFLAVKLNSGDIVVVLLICQIEQLVRFVFTIKRFKSCVWAKDLTKLVV